MSYKINANLDKLPTKPVSTTVVKKESFFAASARLTAITQNFNKESK